MFSCAVLQCFQALSFGTLLFLPFIPELTWGPWEVQCWLRSQVLFPQQKPLSKSLSMAGWLKKMLCTITKEGFHLQLTVCTWLCKH